MSLLFFSNCFARVRGNLLIFGSWNQFPGFNDVAFDSSEQKLGMFCWNSSPSWPEMKSKAGLTCIPQQLQSRREGFLVGLFGGNSLHVSKDSFCWPTSLDSLGFTWCCCVQSILFYAKYERSMSSHCQWDGRSFSLWPLFKGFVLKLCSFSVLFIFLPVLAKTNDWVARSALSNIDWRIQSGTTYTCKTSACTQACMPAHNLSTS